MMGWYFGDFGWAGWLVMTLMMLVFWGLLIFGGVAVFRSLRRDDTIPTSGRSDPQQLLDERFARGEIDADEYQERSQLLHSGH